MIAYALAVTFALGALVGCFLTFFIIVKLDDMDKAKKQKKEDFESGSRQAVKLVGPNPFEAK